MEDTLIITTEEQLQRYLKKYNCKDEQELDELLWFDYGVSLKVNIKPKKTL